MQCNKRAQAKTPLLSEKKMPVQYKDAKETEKNDKRSKPVEEVTKNLFSWAYRNIRGKQGEPTGAEPT